MVKQGQPRAAIYARQSKNKAKSIADQLVECWEYAGENDYVIVSEFKDGRSASRYARNRREDWPKVLAAVAAREFDVLVLWEASRGDRTLTTWSAFLDLCRENDVLIGVVNDGRVYDMSIDSDWKALATAGVDSAHESAKLSKRIRRGVASAARSGRPPAGPCPFGYRRVFDLATGALAKQEIDPETAPIVREIIERVGKAVPIGTIATDLNARGVTPPGGGSTWYRQRVRELALSPVYAAKRVHRPGRGTKQEGERSIHDAGWPALVTEAEHNRAVRVLSNPARMTTARPGRQVHLLTYLAECAVCGAGISARSTYYVCRAGCVSVGRAKVDEWVQEVALATLADEEFYGSLRQAGDDSNRVVAEAEAEIEKLERELDGWRQSAIEGDTTPATMAAVETGITAKIRAAERRRDRATVPPGLEELYDGPIDDVAARWKAMTLQAQRTLLRAYFTITIQRAGRSRYVLVGERVTVVPRVSGETRRTMQHDPDARTD